MMADRQDVTFTVQMESKYPPKGGGHSYKCDIEGTECYLDTAEVLQLGQTYVAHAIAGLERKGKSNTLYGKASGIAPAGGAPASGTGTRQTTLPIMAELRAVAELVNTLRNEAQDMDPRTLDTILMEVFKRGAIERMAAYQEGARGGAPSSGPDDEFPRDDDIEC